MSSFFGDKQHEKQDRIEKNMESPPASSDHGDEAFDSSKPFAGVVLCCTSIPPEHRVSAAPQRATLY